MEQVLDLVTRVRNVRAENNIDPGRRVELRLRVASRRQRALLESCRPHIQHLARCTRLEFLDRLDLEGPAARGVATGVEFAIPLAGLLDVAAEQGRLKREIDKLERELAAHQRKLASAEFLSRAPAEVVARTRALAAELRGKKDRLEVTLRQLSAGGPAA
jgi:valyl-tRNA synthetase